MRYTLLAASTALFLTAAPDNHALELSLSLFEDSEYTTNSGLTESNEVEEWIHSPGASLTAEHAGPNLNVGVDYTLTRRIYQADLYENETEAAGSANLLWNAIPERLDFTINHTRTQSAIRSINAATPDNRQETVNTEAGPTLRFNPRGADQILIQYLWGKRSADVTETDAETHNTSVSYVLAMSPISNLTLALTNNQVQYENPNVPDLEYRVAQLTLNRQLREINYSLMGGYNTTARTQGRDDVNGFIFDAQMDWQARPTTKFAAGVSRSIDDQSQSLYSGVFVEDLDVPTDSDLSEVFTNERASFSVAQELGERTSVSLGATFDREDYEDVNRNTNRTSYNLGLSRQLNRRMDLNFDVSLANEDFKGDDDEADTLRSYLSLNWSLVRRLNLTLGVGYEERDSNSNLSTRNYDEWSGYIRISYEAIRIAAIR